MKRIRKGDWKWKTVHCSNCQGSKHNSRTCRFAPALNRRQQRIRDRELSISSGTSSSRSSRLSVHSDEELSPAESDFDSDDLQDLRLQAEIEQYNAIVAKAHVAAENDRQRRQQEQEQEQEQE